jgi:hypothetical protein
MAQGERKQSDVRVLRPGRWRPEVSHLHKGEMNVNSHFSKVLNRTGKKQVRISEIAADFRKEQIFILLPFPLNTIRNTPTPKIYYACLVQGGLFSYQVI